MASIPLIDLTHGSQSDIVAQVASACSQYGFFSLKGHAIPPLVTRAAFENSQCFFNLPQAAKLALHINQSPCHRGFDPIGWQSLDLSKQGDAKAADLKESFYIGTEAQLDAPLPVPNHGTNQWPLENAMPDFASAINIYRDQMRSLAFKLMGLIAQSLNLPANAFNPFMRYPTCTTRLLYYPPQPGSSLQQIGSGAHTDWGGITILAQDDAGGLEVRLPNSEWVNVQPQPDTLVINTGDLMQRWTNDKYRSSWHRVINRHAGRPRYSIAYFFDLDHHAVIETLPTCIDEQHPAKYGPITAGEHILEMYRKTTLSQ